MNRAARRITLDEWDERYATLREGGLREPRYGGPLRRHAQAGDVRLLRLKTDDSPAALRLWNFLLTEEERLQEARDAGHLLVGTMKDLGTVPVLAYSFERVTAFYPDGAWWIPCLMEGRERLFPIADSLGIDDSFCPVRALLGAFVTEAHFPRPDLLTCSVGATCDDLSAIAQRLEGLGHPILWWEIPHRRPPEEGELGAELPGGFRAFAGQVDFVERQLSQVRAAFEHRVGQALDDDQLRAGIRRANDVRRRLRAIRQLTFTAPACPLPALELLIAEMLAIHFCSDQQEAGRVLDDLLEETRRRVLAGTGVLPTGAARVYWVNPVADLRVMNLLEDLGGRVCGTEYMISHAIEPIPEDVPPMTALARMALADPMVGSPLERAERICAEALQWNCEAVVVSRIPGASHCALEAPMIADLVRSRLGVPVVDLEVPSLSDALEPALCNRLEALIETVRGLRNS